MICIQGWGTEKNAKNVAMHLFILDIVTDFPLIIAILVEGKTFLPSFFQSVPNEKKMYVKMIGSYRYHPIIFIDILWKTLSTIRSMSYYMVYYVWLAKGEKKLSKNKTSKPEDEPVR